MKIRNYIIILLVLGVLLYAAKDDVTDVYNHAATYLNKEGVAVPMAIKSTPDTSSVKTTDKTESVNTHTAVVTPGPLRSATDFLGVTKPNTLSASTVIVLTNKERAQNGNLPELKENKTLDATAAIKLQDMFAQQYFEHISPKGVGVKNLADNAGYRYILIGENLALGYDDNATLLAAWMASPGHRANILNSKYTEIGVAVGHGMFNGHDTWLAVQHFGLPSSACPSTDEVLNGVIEANQAHLDTMAADLAVRREHIKSGAVYDGMSTNEQITAYNTLVAQYNALVAEIKQQIATYNGGVEAHNACIDQNTSGQTSISE